MGYPTERKEAILKSYWGMHIYYLNSGIKAIAEAEGISEATLYSWRKAARDAGRLMPDGDRVVVRI